ncbi:hypothetical protein [uncultured Chryseobacterium sp.]|uniref:hypothetical protein n=1 Tax=uncultured Chryseobacterium sp. TaxID=259322 RepID=UPI0025E0C520|nr:hypothetical protein [uncultured Chryseobacterium sp.]
MKINVIFLLICCLANIKCISQNSSTDTVNNSKINQRFGQIEKIELTERTRGTDRVFTFESASLNISLNGTTTLKELSKANWDEIIKQASLIDLSKISTYTAPTTGRYSDSALSSTIIITSAGKTYESASFDEEIPPKELEGLYLLLKGKSKIIKKR